MTAVSANSAVIALLLNLFIGISLIPAVLTTAGVCGVRILRIEFVFPKIPEFKTIMTVYTVSLSVTALLMLIALIFC